MASTENIQGTYTYAEMFDDADSLDELRAALEEAEDQHGPCIIMGTDDSRYLISDMSAEEVAKTLREEIERIESGRQVGE